MTFAITPTTGFNPPTDAEFPDYMQFQADGVDLGDRAADTLNFGPGLSASRGTGEAANIVTVDAADGGALTWRRVPGDGTLVAGDLDNGIIMSATSGAPQLLVGASVITEGRSVLVAAVGGTDCTIAAGVGLALIYRQDVFQNMVYANGIVTLIGLDDDSVLLCGDLIPV